ncbi:protein of unknown function [Rhodovastum atsumiense]|nr:protein of unknown function [Rhodovastum atsumiense]
MDLTQVIPVSLLEWLPRPRGDGPLLCGTVSSASMAPPPTRGWT